MSDSLDRPLRILRAIPFFEPATGFGGSVTHAAAVSQELASRGHRIRVITSDLGIDPAMPRLQWLPYRGFEVLYAPTAQWHRRPPYLPPKSLLPVLDQELGHANLCTINVGLTVLGHAVRRRARRLDVPYVFNAEGAHCPERLNIKRLQKVAFVHAIERRVLRDATALQAVTRKEAEDYQRLGATPDRIHVIPNGVALRPRESVATGLDFRRSLRIPESATVVLFSGRLHAIKGIDLLLGAMSERMRDDPDLWFLVVGPDEGCRAQLEQQARAEGVEARVVFAGARPVDERDRAMAAADLFALTSWTEGLPLALLEAAAASLPLLVTDRCNVPEVEEFDAGVVVAPDIRSIGAGLDELLCDPRTRTQRGENAGRMVREVFDLRGVVDRLEGLYRSIARTVS